jgi:hypothetical protein
MCRVMINWVKDESPWFPEFITVEKDVRHSPNSTAVWTCYVITCCRAEGGQAIGMKCMVCHKLECSTLKCAQFTCEDSGDERVEDR